MSLVAGALHLRALPRGDCDRELNMLYAGDMDLGEVGGEAHFSMGLVGEAGSTLSLEAGFSVFKNDVPEAKP